MLPCLVCESSEKRANKAGYVRYSVSDEWHTIHVCRYLAIQRGLGTRSVRSSSGRLSPVVWPLTDRQTTHELYVHDAYQRCPSQRTVRQAGRPDTTAREMLVYRLVKKQDDSVQERERGREIERIWNDRGVTVSQKWDIINWCTNVVALTMKNDRNKLTVLSALLFLFFW